MNFTIGKLRNSNTSLKRKNSSSETDEVCEDKITGIAELQRYCSRLKLEYPCYKIIETTDFFNNKLFTVHCTVKNFKETATGKNKKQAKHKSAHFLLERLRYRAVNSGNNFINENSEDSLEEGEIDDREEGEIKDDDTEEKGKDHNGKRDDKGDDGDDESPRNGNKRIRYKLKKVYLEGNVKDNNINLVNDNQNKSQVQLLAEFCYEQKLPSPRYEISEHPGINAPIFTCQCSVLQLVVRTSGIKKEIVKEKSSKLLLTKMKKHSDILKSSDDKDIEIKDELEEGEIPDESKNSTRGSERTHKRKKMRMEKNENSKSNVVAAHNDTGMGELYNFCLKLKIPPPVYTMLDKRDVSANKKIFTFQCSVLKFSKKGHGLNKKQAKHRAAKMVLEKLQDWNKADLQENESDLLEEGEITDQDEAVKQEYIKRKMETDFVSKEEKNLMLMESITQRHNIVKTNTAYVECKTLNFLSTLDDLYMTQHASLLLNKLCKEMDITYNFIDFKSQINTVTSLYLNSVPPWSTFGSGETKEEAQLNAAKQMLIFLKNMTL